MLKEASKSTSGTDIFLKVSRRERWRETLVFNQKRERRWFVLERPRRDTNGGSETEVTVTSKLQANAERNKETEKRQKREEKAASFGGAVRDSVPEDELSGGGARHSDAEVLKREKGGNDDVTSKFG